MTVTIILFLVFTLTILWVGKKLGDKKTATYLISGWIIKCFAGLLFIYAYTYYYGNGKLVEDSGAYLNEAKNLVDIKSKNPSDFYSILFNGKKNEELISYYFKDEAKSRISRNKPGINDTRNHIKTIAVLMLFVGQNNSTIFIIYFFLSFVGFAVLWLSLKDKVRINLFWSFLLLFLTPSLLFWTSSNLKEAPFILGLCLLLAFFFSGSKNLSKKLMLAIGFVLLLFYKPILLVILIVCCLAIHLIQKVIYQKKYLFTIPFVFLVFLLFYFSFPNKILKTISDQQFDFINIARGGIQVRGDTSFYFISSKDEYKVEILDSTVTIKNNITAISNLFGKIRNEKSVVLKPDAEKLNLVHYQKAGGSYFKISPINNNWLSFFTAVPESLLNALLRPFPINNDFSILNLIFFLENSVFVILLILGLQKFKQIPKDYIILATTCLISALIFGIIIGITTPSTGAIVRYRVPIQLLIIIVFLLTKLKHERSI